MNTTTDKTTPRPWGYGYHRGLDEHLVGVTLENVAIIEDRHENAAENAALIVRAVNAHDDLVAALRDLVSVPDIVGGPHDVPRYHCRYCGRDYSPVEGLDTPLNCPSDDCRAWQARDALAKAEGA